MGAGAASEGEGGAVRAPLQLVGYDNFKRHNPRSDRFVVHRFHHIEFWCGDATNTFKRCVRPRRRGDRAARRAKATPRASMLTLR